MSDKSLSDKAVRVAVLIEEVESLLSNTNDYGEATGFCSEFDRIYEDASNLLGSLSVRASSLRTRFNKTSKVN